MNKDLLQRARQEIIGLRRQNEILNAKVEVMDLFGLTLRTQPNYNRSGETIDVAWELEIEINKPDEQI